MSTPMRFAFFDTPIGPCAVVWTDRGIVGLQLPEPDAKARARVRRRFLGAFESPPEGLADVIAAIVALLDGKPADLSTVPLDMARVQPFNRRVYEVARFIRPGATLTYGEIATQLGDPQLAREVGKALGANPFPLVVPCHRVVAAGGKLGGFTAHGGARTKLRLLSIESALAGGKPTLFNQQRQPDPVRPA